MSQTTSPKWIERAGNVRAIYAEQRLRLQMIVADLSNVVIS
ncbi:MAG: hypothetical protein R3B66_14910 [Candidatus Scalinduaceae bacterium]